MRTGLPDLSACAATSCGAAAPVGRGTLDARAGPGATPRPEGLVRHSAECVFTPSPLPSKGRSRANHPLREGHPNAAWGRGGSTRSSSGCPPLPKRLAPVSPARVRTRSRWPRPPTATLATGTVIRVCHLRSALLRVSSPVHAGRRHFEAAGHSSSPDRPGRLPVIGELGRRRVGVGHGRNHKRLDKNGLVPGHPVPPKPPTLV